MGKFIDRFKKLGGKIDEKANQHYQKNQNTPKNFNSRLKEKTPESISQDIYEGIDDGLGGLNEMDDYDELGNPINPNFNQHLGGFNDLDNYGVGIQPAQKPESFHHFILENQYKDLEKSIRGYKDVYNKDKSEWETKRKEIHCFTDEEAEEILRTAQSHLATDIKLSFINKETFGEMMMAIYKRLDELFYAIAEYRYGRYSHDSNGKQIEGGYQKEYQMKLQNRKIFLELWTRVQANYSRAISGAENRATHQSVQGQESLQSADRMSDKNRRYS